MRVFEEIGFFAEEGRELAGLLRGLPEADWQRVTPFKNWTVWDVIAHLHLSDLWAHASLDGPEAFGRMVAPALQAIQRQEPLSAVTRAHLGALDGPALLAAWLDGLERLCERFAAADPAVRLTWFGPPMGVRMFATARYMETWAHGQDIYDLLGRHRRYTDAIRAIATLGVRTYGFNFSLRGEKAPEPQPYVRLTAPSGAIWEWNAPSDVERIEGPASDFCHVVTQGRHVDESALRTTGDNARRWMSIAQCFAGMASDPPAPGRRTANFRAA